MILGMTVVGSVLLTFIWWPLVALAVLGLRRKTRPATLAGKAGLALFAVVLALLPTVDAAWIDWRFKRLCDGAGLRAQSQVAVDGYYDPAPLAALENEPADAAERQALYARLAKGMRFIERGMSAGGKIVRIEQADGAWRKRLLDKPEARYRVVRQDIAVGGGIVGLREEVIDGASGASVGSMTSYQGKSGFVDGIWLRLFESGPFHQCPHGMHPFPQGLLIPGER